MHIKVTSYAEVKKILGSPIQCIGSREGCLAYVNFKSNGLSKIVLLSKDNPLNSRKKRQK